MERVTERGRHQAEAAKRDAVAAEVKRLIDESGLSRLEVVSRIGTSASRLSTYAIGKVVPSAALMLRMRTVGTFETSSEGSGGFASLAGVWSGRVKISDDFD